MKYSITCDHCKMEYGLANNETEARSLRPHIEFMHHSHTHGNILPEKFTFNSEEEYGHVELLSKENIKNLL